MEEIKKEIKICKETNENEKHNNPKFMGFSKSIAIQAYLKKPKIFQEKNQIT